MKAFDAVADPYDAARPRYPAGVYDALGDLTGLDVLDGGAGTGIATQALADRGANVVPCDVGEMLLKKTRSAMPGVPAVVADGAQLPFADASFDLICFAQAWHWLDEGRRCPEAARVLRPGGRWAGWWSHARADDEPWFDAHWSAIEAACPGVSRSQRDTDWGATVATSGLFNVADLHVVPWVRELSVEAWMADLETHSYVIALSDDERRNLVETIADAVTYAFPSGTMRVPYETWLWVGTRIDDEARLLGR